jgi:hypothetical protein
MLGRSTIIQNARTSTGRGPAYLVYEFNQRHTLQYKLTGTDFCAGLALRWLVLHMRGKDFAYDDKTQVLSDPGDEPMQIQNVYVTGHAKGFSQAGLKEDWQKSTKHAVQPGLLMDTASTSGMYFLQLRHTAESGHAVALTIHSFGASERAVNYFDANLGSFYFGCRHDFVDWFDWVLSLPMLPIGTPPKPTSYESHYADHWTLFRLTKS